MRVTCILTSYNRPNFIRQALRSVEQQTWSDFELLVQDESDPQLLDIKKVVSEFSFPKVEIRIARVTPAQRAGSNRLAITINDALRRAQGDLVCYLADDDFLFPGWFEEGVTFFSSRPNAQQAFGALHYSSSSHMDFNTSSVRFYDHAIVDPLGALDHNQVMHRRRRPPVFWPEGYEMRLEPDGRFFRELAHDGPFHPIPNSAAAVKRLHGKRLQRSPDELDGIRE